MSELILPRPRTGIARRRLRFLVWTFRGSPSTLLGLVLVAVFLVLAAVGPWLVPDPRDATGAMHLAQRLLPPSAAHWFGTDEMGDDIFTRVVIGTRTSLWVGLTITGIAMLIGVPLGIISGYRGKMLRAVIMRVTDVFLAVPGLVLALAIVAALGPSTLHGVVALSLVWWPGYVRLIEAKALTLRGEPYVEAARTMGAGHGWILMPPHPAQLRVAAGGEGQHGHGTRGAGGSVAGLHRPRSQASRAGMGGDDLGCAQLHAGPMVVQLLPRAVHFPHRARLQPARRRAAGHPRSAQRAWMRGSMSRSMRVPAPTAAMWVEAEAHLKRHRYSQRRFFGTQAARRTTEPEVPRQPGSLRLPCSRWFSALPPCENTEHRAAPAAGHKAQLRSTRGSLDYPELANDSA